MTENGSSEGDNLDKDAGSDYLDQDTGGGNGDSDSLDRGNDGVDAVEEESVISNLIDKASNVTIDQPMHRTYIRVVRALT